MVLRGSKRQEDGERFIIRSVTIFAAIKWMRRSWAGHLVRTGKIINLHRIIVGRAKKENVSEGMALFGSAVSDQRQSFRDVAGTEFFFEHPNYTGCFTTSGHNCRR